MSVIGNGGDDDVARRGALSVGRASDAVPESFCRRLRSRLVARTHDDGQPTHGEAPRETATLVSGPAEDPDARAVGGGNGVGHEFS